MSAYMLFSIQQQHRLGLQTYSLTETDYSQERFEDSKILRRNIYLFHTINLKSSLAHDVRHSAPTRASAVLRERHW
jgi:hypothetical protein